jgi:hypothetical protein
MDGFDHYNNIGTDKGYNGWNPTSQHVNYSRSGNGLGLLLLDFGRYIRKDIGQNLTTVYIGIAFRKSFGSNPGYHSNYPLVAFKDESGVDQVKIHPNSSYGFSAYRGDNTLLGSTSDDVYNSYKWYFLEIRVTISNTVGIVTMRINESQVLNLTSKDTRNGSEYIRYIAFGHLYNGGVWYDDFYIDSSQFHGDCEVKTFYPDADGNSSDFTRSTGSNDYECVDEAQSNEDTDYIYSDTLNHKSLFGITTGALGTVKGIQVNQHIRLDQAGTRKITPLIRSNSTNYSGTETDNISQDYIFYTEVWETDPDDSNAWTQTKLEAAEFGLEITT